ncbi:MAG TPA: hypothetical protein VF177_05605 [Anaerolineae bacterium]
MTNRRDEQNVSRRGFLKAAAATAMAATATGAGAAILNNKSQQPVLSQPAVTYSVAPSPDFVPPTVPAATVDSSSDLLAQLAAVQGENVRLQEALASAQQQLEALQQAQNGSNGAAEDLRVQLGEANQRISVLGGLIALYEQLEEVEIGDTVDQGLAAMSTTITDLLNKTPFLSQGIEAGQVALAEFENHIPLLENGREWLYNQAARLQVYFDTVRSLLEQTVETVGPILEMINQWLAEIRKWLPFGTGARAAEIVQAFTTLLNETPHTISGLHTNIVEPLDVWLAGSGNEKPLQQKLIKPLREQVFVQASETVNQARQVEATYKAQLAEPVRTAIDNRRALRNLIAEYRQQHQV